ncbi:hypothetical protein AFL01nite_27900 [Aeromicrobium flavum]|uniref:Uncharacterized protein n=1 Tax=Aeromicrobium flavum TaxID=416568 RepID=A0A512HYD2_9ACTN|nr:hypothetical protein [Aeromicrobium flavum]GEO90463.1 hypothetical protein AFL01nite_27900 [Aeromicrobium flavum]
MTIPSSAGGWLLAGLVLACVGAVVLAIGETSEATFVGWGLVVSAVLAAQVGVVAKGVELGLAVSRRE